MTAYIGPWGNLVEFQCPSAVEISMGSRSSFMTTLGGRVVEQRGPSPRRSWQVGIGVAKPHEIAGLEALLAGAYGAPPWAWISPDAAAQNMLMPAASRLDIGTYSSAGMPSGSRTAVDGVRLARTISCVEGDWVFFGTRANGQGTPVRAGDVVTGSVYAEGSGLMRMVFFDEVGGWTGSLSKQLGEGLERHALSASVPTGSVEVAVRVDATEGIVVAGAPAITLTNAPVPWAVGKGCAKATVDGLDTTVLRAVRGSDAQNISRYAFTIRELG